MPYATPTGDLLSVKGGVGYEEYTYWGRKDTFPGPLVGGK